MHTRAPCPQVCGSVARYALQAAHLAASAQAQAEQAVAAAAQLMVPTPDPPFSLDPSSFAEVVPGPAQPAPPEGPLQQFPAAATPEADQPSATHHPSADATPGQQQRPWQAGLAAPVSSPTAAAAPQGHGTPFAATSEASEPHGQAAPDTPGRGSSSRVTFPAHMSATETTGDGGFLTTKPLHPRPSAPLLNLGRFTSDPYLGRRSDLAGMEHQQQSRRSNLMFAHGIAHDVGALVNGPGGLPLSPSGGLAGHMGLSVSGQPALLGNRQSFSVGLASPSSTTGGGGNTARGVHEPPAAPSTGASRVASSLPTSRPSSAHVRSPHQPTMMGRISSADSTGAGPAHEPLVRSDSSADAAGQTQNQNLSIIRQVKLSDLDPSELLCRSFRLSAEDIQELSWGVLGAVKAAGGYPVITVQGHIVSQDGRVIAPAQPGHELPGKPGGGNSLVCNSWLLRQLSDCNG